MCIASRSVECPTGVSSEIKRPLSLSVCLSLSVPVSVCLSVSLSPSLSLPPRMFPAMHMNVTTQTQGDARPQAAGRQLSRSSPRGAWSAATLGSRQLAVTSVLRWPRHPPHPAPRMCPRLLPGRDPGVARLSARFATSRSGRFPSPAERRPACPRVLAPRAPPPPPRPRSTPRPSSPAQRLSKRPPRPLVVYFPALRTEPRRLTDLTGLDPPPSPQRRIATFPAENPMRRVPLPAPPLPRPLLRLTPVHLSSFNLVTRFWPGHPCVPATLCWVLKFTVQ